MEDIYSEEGLYQDALSMLANQILTKRELAVKARAASGVERRWLEDEDAFDGNEPGNRQSMVSYATGESFVRGNEPRRSRVLVNVIRGRCDQAEGRFADIMLPVDDRNWGLKTTPVPTLMQQLKNKTPVSLNGQPVVDDEGPVTLGKLAKNEIETAKEKMKRMEADIDDQLTKCSFNAECRKVVRDAVKVGTGILKGPSVIAKIRKSWRWDEQAGAYIMEAIEEHRPYSKRVDYWNVFPDPHCGDDIKKASYVWERDYVLPRELRRLIGVEGYLDDQIQLVLSEDPKRTMVGLGEKKTLELETSYRGKGDAYEIWEYNGDLNAEELEALGCDCQGMKGVLSACVVFANDRPIKAALNALDTGDLPYDFFTWTPVSGSVWGIGVARILMWVQRVITASWRAMMDNAGDSAGANVVIGMGIQPADGKWELTGKKLWRYDGDIQDVSKAFAQFQLQNNQKELQAIIELALKFADIETAMPMAFPQEPMGPPETLGAVELKIDASNVALRSRVKYWDDQITRPHLTRYYHWNMQYSDNDEVKGDYEVDPRGTSILLQRERASQAILQMMELKGDPLFGAIIDWKKAIKFALAAQKIDILKPDEEIEEIERQLRENPQQDPRAIATQQAAQVKAESEIKREQMRQEGAKLELQVDSEEAKMKREHDLQIAMLNREIKMLELAQRGDITLQEIKAMLSKEAMKLTTQKELAGTSPQVAKPPIEPPGRAPAGSAYAL